MPESGAAPGAGGAGEVVTDVDGFCLPWLRGAGIEAMVARPDFYLFGAVPAAAQLPALLDELLARLAGCSP